MFKNAVETLNYFAEQCKVFEPIKEAFVNLTEENKSLKETHQQAIGELAKTKVENMQMKSISQQALSELAVTKIKLMQIETKLNEKDGR